jgi:hypothetical protein
MDNFIKEWESPAENESIMIKYNELVETNDILFE